MGSWPLWGEVRSLGWRSLYEGRIGIQSLGRGGGKAADSGRRQKTCQGEEHGSFREESRSAELEEGVWGEQWQGW